MRASPRAARGLCVGWHLRVVASAIDDIHGRSTHAGQLDVALRAAAHVAAPISDLLWEQFVLAAKNGFARPLVTGGGARVACSNAAADAVTACMAMPVLQADDTEIAAQRLQWLTTSMRRRGFSPMDSRNCWNIGHSPSLDALRRTVLSSRSLHQHRTTRPFPGTGPQLSAV